jgi:hypothetical protein
MPNKIIPPTITITNPNNIIAFLVHPRFLSARAFLPNISTN